VTQIPIDLANLEFRVAYHILSNLIVPRPIAFVSTLGENGVANLAPFSFFMAGGSRPPSLCFSPTPSREGDKDTLRNIRETGEYVVNLLDAPMLHGMNATSATLPPHESEWPASGFTPAESRVVKAPRVAEAPAAFECKLFEIVEHGEGPGAARYVIGEVVFAFLRADVWDGERVQRAGLSMLARLGGDDYLATGASSVFSLPRPS
jgi:flavin reductase (DIM6/NTAB) family NADH-FMN oxidoreductase RutF